jgi:hypothetical protein
MVGVIAAKYIDGTAVPSRVTDGSKMLD